jgi:hypothetical protein
MNNGPLRRVNVFLLDMDGTFNINELDLDCLFLTNNTSKHRRLCAEKATQLGLPIPEELGHAIEEQPLHKI